MYYYEIDDEFAVKIKAPDLNQLLFLQKQYPAGDAFDSEIEASEWAEEYIKCISGDEAARYKINKGVHQSFPISPIDVFSVFNRINQSDILSNSFMASELERIKKAAEFAESLKPSDFDPIKHRWAGVAVGWVESPAQPEAPTE